MNGSVGRGWAADGDLASRQAKRIAAPLRSGGLHSSEQFPRLLADSGIVCSMSRSGSIRDNAAMESCFSSFKTERTARKNYRTRNEAKADVFDYTERFYNTTRRHSTIGYDSPVEFERKLGLAELAVHQTGSRSTHVDQWKFDLRVLVRSILGAIVLITYDDATYEVTRVSGSTDLGNATWSGFANVVLLRNSHSIED